MFTKTAPMRYTKLFRPAETNRLEKQNPPNMVSQHLATWEYWWKSCCYWCVVASSFNMAPNSKPPPIQNTRLERFENNVKKHKQSMLEGARPFCFILMTVCTGALVSFLNSLLISFFLVSNNVFTSLTLLVLCWF